MPNSNSHGARKSLGALTGPLRLTAAVGTAFSYAFPEDTFNDADSICPLTYTSTKADDSMLPTWLSFTAASATRALNWGLWFLLGLLTLSSLHLAVPPP